MTLFTVSFFSSMIFGALGLLGGARSKSTLLGALGIAIGLAIYYLCTFISAKLMGASDKMKRDAGATRSSKVITGSYGFGGFVVLLGSPAIAFGVTWLTGHIIALVRQASV